MNNPLLRYDITLPMMIKLFFLILSTSLMAMGAFPNGIYAMESSHKMACCEKGQEHKNCCKKKDGKKHHSSEKKDTNKSCNQKNSACLCIGFISTMAMKNQYVDYNQNVFIALSKKYMLTNDKKPSLVYLDLWLLPKIKS